MNLLCAILSFCIVLYHGSGALAHKMLGGVFLPLYYYVYFFAGYIVLQYKPKILEYRKLTIILSSSVYLLTVFVANDHLVVFKCLSYILILVTICNYFESQLCISRSGKVWSAVEKISWCSFGIYVFHQYILWNITRIPDCLNLIRPYMEDYYAIFPILLYVVVFAVSYGITRLSLQTTVGRYLLL